LKEKLILQKENRHSEKYKNISPQTGKILACFSFRNFKK